MESLMEKSARDLLRMQAKFNGIFIHKRDAGQDVNSIYKYLKTIEGELSRRRINWYYAPRQYKQRS